VSDFGGTKPGYHKAHRHEGGPETCKACEAARLAAVGAQSDGDAWEEDMVSTIRPKAKFTKTLRVRHMGRAKLTAPMDMSAEDEDHDVST
jgi:hypothetical protein